MAYLSFHCFAVLGEAVTVSVVLGRNVGAVQRRTPGALRAPPEPLNLDLFRPEGVRLKLRDEELLTVAQGTELVRRDRGDGGLAGPDLSYVGGRYKPRELLEDLLLPSKVINPQYGQVVYELKNGKLITGRVVETKDDFMIVATNPTNPLADHVRVTLKDVEHVGPSRVSSMPEGLLNTLTRDEVFDLVAYLLDR